MVSTSCPVPAADRAPLEQLCRYLLRPPVAQDRLRLTSDGRVLLELPTDAPRTPRYWAWADLMRRAFDIDVLACPRCGGRMRLLATIEDPRVMRQILAHLGLPTEVPRSPPVRAADFSYDIHA